MNNNDDVVSFLKSRFVLIEKIQSCSSPSHCSWNKQQTLPKSASCDTFVHFVATRESLEAEDEQQAPRRKFFWNILFLRIGNRSGDNEKCSLETILAHVFPIENSCEELKGNDFEEKRLLVLEEGGGFSVREAKLVV